MAASPNAAQSALAQLIRIEMPAGLEEIVPGYLEARSEELQFVAWAWFNSQPVLTPRPARDGAFAVAFASGIPADAVVEVQYPSDTSAHVGGWNVTVNGHPEYTRWIDDLTCELRR